MQAHSELHNQLQDDVPSIVITVLIIVSKSLNIHNKIKNCLFDQNLLQSYVTLYDVI